MKVDRLGGNYQQQDAANPVSRRLRFLTPQPISRSGLLRSRADSLEQSAHSRTSSKWYQQYTVKNHENEGCFVRWREQCTDVTRFVESEPLFKCSNLTVSGHILLWMWQEQLQYYSQWSIMWFRHMAQLSTTMSVTQQTDTRNIRRTNNIRKNWKKWKEFKLQWWSDDMIL